MINWQQFGEKMIELGKKADCETCPGALMRACVKRNENPCQLIIKIAKAMGVEGV